MSKPTSAGFVIFRRSEGNSIEYLLLQASDGGHHWTPPKKGESPLQAAERETKEEAGLDKNDIEYYHQFEEKITYDADGRPKDVFYYLACIRNTQQDIKLSDEHQNSVWLNLQDACDLVNHYETQNLLRKAEQFILNYEN